MRRDVYLAGKTANERETGLDKDDIKEARLVDPNTGQPIELAEDDQAHYDAENFEQTIQIPERVRVMAEDYFMPCSRPAARTRRLSSSACATIMPARSRSRSTISMPPEVADQGVRPAQDFAFKCTAEAGGSKLIPLFKEAPRGRFHRHDSRFAIDRGRCTGDPQYGLRPLCEFAHPVLSNGRARNRLDPASDKLMFRIYDYTEISSRLFGHDFISAAARARARGEWACARRRWIPSTNRVVFVVHPRQKHRGGQSEHERPRGVLFLSRGQHNKVRIAVTL